MVISPELRFQQERNVSDLLSRGDEMGEYYPFMRGFAFDDPLGIVVKHSNFYDQDIQQDLANYKIFPNLDVRSLKVEPIKNGFWENISLVIEGDRPIAIHSKPSLWSQLPNDLTVNTNQVFLDSTYAMMKAGLSPIRATPVIIGHGGFAADGSLFDVRSIVSGEEINLNAKISQIDPDGYEVYPRFFTLNSMGNISLVNTLMESTAPEIRASMTKYFTSKLISLRTIMTASTIHEDNREMVAFTPKSLRFSPGDPMGRFTEQGTLDLRAVAFPLGYSTLRSFDGIVTNVLTQREVAYIDKGLNEGPRSIIEMFDQIPPMKDRLGFVRNIISFTIQNIMELNGGDGYPEIKKGVWEIVKNGEVITPHSVKNSTSTNSIDEIVGNRSDFERILPPLTFSF